MESSCGLEVKESSWGLSMGLVGRMFCRDVVGGCGAEVMLAFFTEDSGRVSLDGEYFGAFCSFEVPVIISASIFLFCWCSCCSLSCWSVVLLVGGGSRDIGF